VADSVQQGIRMKNELAIDPARFVNLYACKLILPLIAGYATFPNEFPEDDRQHCVVIDYGTMPGNARPLGLGHTLVHEIGYYFGLFHTLEGGCGEPGDAVARHASRSVGRIRLPGRPRHLRGTIVFTFTDCNSGQVSWEPVADYTKGSMPITRLTMPAGLSCP
jgi:hypothetical protein